MFVSATHASFIGDDHEEKIPLEVMMLNSLDEIPCPNEHTGYSNLENTKVCVQSINTTPTNYDIGTSHFNLY